MIHSAHSFSQAIKDVFLRLKEDERKLDENLTFLQRQEHLSYLTRTYGKYEYWKYRDFSDPNSESSQFGYQIRSEGFHNVIKFYVYKFEYLRGESGRIKDKGVVSNVYEDGEFPISIRVGDNITVYYEPRNLDNGEYYYFDKNGKQTTNNRTLLHLNKGDEIEFEGSIGYNLIIFFFDGKYKGRLEFRVKKEFSDKKSTEYKKPQRHLNDTCFGIIIIMAFMILLTMLL